MNIYVYKFANFTAIEFSVSYNSQLADRIKDQILLIKFGGNAMVDNQVKQSVINDIVSLKKLGAVPVIVHGGGPVIRQMLQVAEIESEFIEGHRVTDAEAIRYVEMALSGRVNKELVTLINRTECKAVGLSGKDGKMVTARKRFHRNMVEGKKPEIDLGFVGDVADINPELLFRLIQADYIPVLSPVSTDESGDTYNINADMFAGHMAGALEAAHYVVLTDVDGLLADKNNPASLITNISINEAEDEISQLIQDGMIPKTESCIIAMNQGVQSAHIINGTASHSLLKELLTEERCGTLITR